MYTEEIAYLKHLLDLEKVPITFQWFHRRAVRKKGGTETWGVHLLYDNGTNVVQIATKAYSYSFILDTIAHELRHVWQFHTGTARFEGRKIVWSGTEYFPEEKTYDKIRFPYRERPHEIDARGFAAAAALMFLEQSGKSERLIPLPTVKKSVASLFY